MARESEDAIETVLWEGSPSQWTNCGVCLLAFLLCWLLLPPLWALWRWLQIRSTRYRITTTRFTVRSGVLHVQAMDLPLYRVKDHSLDMPLWLRLVNLGHIDLVTSDATHPNMRLTALPDPDSLREELRLAVERARRNKGVREIDIN